MSGTLHQEGHTTLWKPLTGNETEKSISRWTHNIYHLPWVAENQYLILMVAKELGNLVFSTWINAFACVYPSFPALIQLLNVILWLLNLYYNLVSNIWVTFIWTMVVGGLYGSSLSNFMFLANANTDLHADLNLKMHEREFVVNSLLIANYMG